MDLPPLRADCARCQGLCCMATAFVAGPEFAEDKEAETPCRHLGGDFRCIIHAGRARAGYAGCVGYDCLGAGQRICQEIFAGQNWHDGGRRAMAEGFRVLREIHALLEMLVTAGEVLGLAPEEERARLALLAALHPSEGWTGAELGRFDLPGARAQVQGFLASLGTAARRARKGPKSKIPPP